MEILLNYFDASNLQFYLVGKFIPKVTHLKSIGLLQRWIWHNERIFLWQHSCCIET